MIPNAYNREEFPETLICLNREEFPETLICSFIEVTFNE